MPSVLNTERVKKLLQSVPKSISTDMQAQFTKEAEAIAELARSRVPVRSGALRESIRVEPFNKGGVGAFVRAGGPTTTKPVKHGKSPSYDYGLAQELGTQEMLANPFFYPSYRQRKASVKRNVTAAVKRAVAKITGA